MLILALLPTLLLASSPLDVRVDGEGYMRFIRDGRVVYSKSASLVAAGGKVCHVAGPAVLPTIYVPERAATLSVDLEGNVSASVDGSLSVLGRLVLALFPGDRPLATSEGFLVSADRPRVGDPGVDTHGVIRMEASSVVARVETNAVNATLKASPVDFVNATGKGASITVSASAQVEGHEILLSDVARIEGPSELAARLGAVSLGTTPPIGVPRILDRERILVCLRAAKIETANLLLSVPPKVEVRRRADAIAHQEFVDAAIAYAQQQLGTRATFKGLDSLPDMPVTPGQRELRCDSVNQIGTTAQVVVSVIVDGRTIRSRTIRLGVDLGEIAVKQGDAVRVVLRSGGVVIEVTGYARKTAYLGQSVEVEVRGDQRTTHVGTVIAPGVVEVKS